MSKKETVYNIIQKAEEYDLLVDEYEEKRDEELLKLRGLKLTKNQRQLIEQMGGYIAYELTEKE